jgi:hypothetical protein
MQEGPQGDDVLREGLDGREQMVNTFADQAKTFWKSVGPAGVPVVLSIASWAKMQHAYTQWIRQAPRAVNQP